MIIKSIRILDSFTLVSIYFIQKLLQKKCLMCYGIQKISSTVFSPPFLPRLMNHGWMFVLLIISWAWHDVTKSLYFLHKVDHDKSFLQKAADQLDNKIKW